MKLLIAGDLHGSAKYTGKLLELFRQKQPDKLVLLGDILYHGPRNPLPEDYDPKRVIEMLNGIAPAILAVRGNCEAEVDQMVLQFPVMAEYALLFVDGQTVFVTHGHHYGPENPPPAATGGLLLCGHSHVGAQQEMNGFTYLNPGSLSLPKDGQHSYMLYQDGYFVRKNVEGQVLGSWPPAV